MKLARLTTLTARLRGDHVETRTRLGDVWRDEGKYKDVLQRPLVQELCQLPESEIATDLFAYGEDNNNNNNSDFIAVIATVIIVQLISNVKVLPY